MSNLGTTYKLWEGCVHFWCLFEVLKWQKDCTTVFILVRTLYHEKKTHHKPNVMVLLVTEECCERCKGIESLHISGSWLHQVNAVVCVLYSQPALQKLTFPSTEFSSVKGGCNSSIVMMPAEGYVYLLRHFPSL